MLERRAQGGLALRFADVELLNRVVVGIDDVQMSTTVDRHTVGGQELTGFGSLLFAEVAQVATVAGELLDSAAAGADPQAVFAVATDGDRSMHTSNRLKLAAKAARTILKLAPRQEKGAVGLEFLHATVHRFGRIHVALLVDRDEIGTTSSRSGIGIATKLARLRAVLSPGGKKSALGVEHLHAVIGLIGHVNAAVLSDRQPTWVIEFARAGAGFSPLVEQFACGIVDGETVRIYVFARPGSWKMAEVDAPRIVEPNASRIRQNGEVRQELPVGVELLHAMVTMVRDQDFIRLIDGNPNWEMKFAGFRSLFSPGQEETSRRKVGLDSKREGRLVSDET